MANESKIRPLPPAAAGKSARRYYAKAVAAIFAVIVLHFISQFIFFQNEKISLKTEAINHRSVEVKPESEPESAEIETQSVAKKSAAVTKMETFSPVAQPEPKAMPARVVIKKKESRESRAERLRRAEKILTGV